MNPRILVGIMDDLLHEETMEERLNKMSLQELENEVHEITKKQNQITHWNLSKTLETLVIKELQDQKKELLDVMHRKVNEL